MQVDRAYANQHPGPGAVALLCEGDLLGYEASALRKWLDRRVQAPLVDVWPCGTANAVYGLCDAFGRARPIIAIEDRDFRSAAEADKHCVDRRRDRADRRGLHVVAWRCWRTNEIENYLLEPEVVTQVMADWFGCGEGSVRAALAEVLRTLAVCQAASCALDQTRHAWLLRDPTDRRKDNIKYSPEWGDPHVLIAPRQNDVRDALAERERDWSSWTPPTAGDVGLVATFDECYSRWRALDCDAVEWRLHWSGKEVLKYLRMLLAGQHGWFREGKREPPVAWHAMPNNRERAGLDRQIERTLRPPLVDRFIEWLGEDGEEEARTEWREIADLCRGLA